MGRNVGFGVTSHAPRLTTRCDGAENKGVSTSPLPLPPRTVAPRLRVARPTLGGLGEGVTHERDAQLVDAWALLPQRFLIAGAPSAPRRYRVGTPLGPSVVVTAGPADCRVDRRDARPVDVELVAEAPVWLAVLDGELTILEAFVGGAVRVGGDLEDLLGFAGLFVWPRGHVPTSVRHERVRRLDVSVLELGPEDAPVVVALHGLGVSKLSLLPTLIQLARDHRVLAFDLPGFGRSTAPVGAPYDAPWFADVVTGVLDAAGVDRAAVVGNSLGGRVATELALREPDRVRALGLLCPAVPFDGLRALRPLLTAARVDVPLGVAGWPLGGVGGAAGRAVVDAGVRRLFAVAERVPAPALTAIRDDALRRLADRRRRLALCASARQAAVDRRGSFWPRVTELAVPSLWVFGDRDPIVSPRYADHVRRHAPQAEVEVWPSCGHLPQLEHPHRTAARLGGFFASAL